MLGDFCIYASVRATVGQIWVMCWKAPSKSHCAYITHAPLIVTYHHAFPMMSLLKILLMSRLPTHVAGNIHSTYACCVLLSLWTDLAFKGDLVKSQGHILVFYNFINQIERINIGNILTLEAIDHPNAPVGHLASNEVYNSYMYWS